jgi:carotenoid cleavage dioxygenase
MNAHANPYLTGNFAPVSAELTAFDLRVEGAIPRELNGRLLRNGPNPVGTPEPGNYHWFTGNGMVHGLRLRDGRAEWYRNRFVRDDAVTAAKGWPTTPGPRHGMGSGVANTNVIGHAGRTWAIVEAGGLPVELSDELETVAYSNFGGTLPGSFTAHPKRDPDTGELHAVVYYWEWDYVQYVVVGTDGRVRRTVNVPVPGKPMVHDCAITERYVVLFDLPCTFDVEAAMTTPFPYVWNPDYGARVGLLPRDGGAGDVRWLEVPLCYVFHPLNAYETADGQVVLDVVRHPKMFARDKLGPNEGAPTLDRWLLDPSSGKVREERFDDRGHEFPRHDERRIGKPIRYGYTATLADGLRMGALHKHDLVKRSNETRDEGQGRAFLEPVFVPRTPDAAEDDGWILAYLYDAPSDGGQVVILHAQDFGGDPVARIHLPQRVPFGFHGNWVEDIR